MWSGHLIVSMRKQCATFRYSPWNESIIIKSLSLTNTYVCNVLYVCMYVGMYVIVCMYVSCM